MKNRYKFQSYIKLLLCAALLSWQTVALAQTDSDHEIILVMSNAQSMSANDPDKLARVAALELIDSLDDSVRFGLIYFDDEATVATPLTTLSESREAVQIQIGQLESGSPKANSPDALQAALEMFSDAKSSAQKSMIFLADQAINLNDTHQNDEKLLWLTNDFSTAAAQKGVRIFTIALTKNADNELAEVLATNTFGQFYPAEDAGDLLGIFRKINAQITGQTISISPTSGVSINTLTSYDATISPITEESTATSTTDGEETDMQQDTLPSWSILLVIGFLLAGLLLLIRFKSNDEDTARTTSAVPSITPLAPTIPEAYLEDIHHVTLRKHLDIGTKPTVIGRIVGNQRSKFNYIEIEQPTISREHAIIEYRDNKFYIKDKSSANGTFINDKQISDWQPLNHLDRVRFDVYEFIFVIAEMKNRATVTASPDALLQDATVVNTRQHNFEPDTTDKTQPQNQQQPAPQPKPNEQHDDDDAPTVFIATPKSSAETDKNRLEQQNDHESDEQTVLLKTQPKPDKDKNSD